MQRMRILMLALLATGLVVSVALFPHFVQAQNPATEAPAAFDNLQNGFDTGFGGQTTFLNDMSAFETSQQIFNTIPGFTFPLGGGLGPTFNAQACSSCHENPVIGGQSQVRELRAGHLDNGGNFVAPVITINDGITTINPLTGMNEPPTIPFNCSNPSSANECGRSLINLRYICPAIDANQAHLGPNPPTFSFPDTSVAERVPSSESVRTLRISLNLLGDGFVEAIADSTIQGFSTNQCNSVNTTVASPAFVAGDITDSTVPNPANGICGEVVEVLVQECHDPNNGQNGQPQISCPNGDTAVGRFGWKDQIATLLTFSADAYLNEMGISNRLPPDRDDFTHYCNIAVQPNDPAGFTPPNGQPNSSNALPIDSFTRFVRATKAPPRDPNLVNTPEVIAGSKLFSEIGCSICHVSSITTAPAGTTLGAGAITVSPALGNKVIHPFSDFLLHDIGTGDGIVQTFPLQDTANKVRTAPLWGVRVRPTIMHDGLSVNFDNSSSIFNSKTAPSLFMGAILRHAGEATNSIKNFQALSAAKKSQVISFLSSL